MATMAPIMDHPEDTVHQLITAKLAGAQGRAQMHFGKDLRILRCVVCGVPGMRRSSGESSREKTKRAMPLLFSPLSQRMVISFLAWDSLVALS